MRHSSSYSTLTRGRCFATWRGCSVALTMPRMCVRKPTSISGRTVMGGGGG